MKLGSQTNLLPGFAFKSGGYTSAGEGVALLRGDNIVQGQLRWNGVKRWPLNDVEQYSAYRLAEGDIVIAMDRTWVKAGIKFARIGQRDLPLLLVQRVARLRCHASLSVDYLYHLVGSSLFESYVLDIQTGLGVPHISGGQIEAFSFHLPDSNRQAKISDELDMMQAETSKLADTYRQNAEYLRELQRALLSKAFSGQLTTRAAA